MRTALPALLVAVLLATAGCTSGFGGSTPGDAATEMPTDSATETPTDSATGTPTDATTKTPTGIDRLPDPLTTDGRVNPKQFVTAHAAVLAEQSVTLRERQVRKYDDDRGWHRNRTLRTAANRTRFLRVLVTENRPIAGATEGRGATFADGTRVYRTVETPNSSWSSVLRGPDGDPEDPSEVRLDVARSDDLTILLNAFALNDSATVRNATAGPDSTADSGRYLVETSTVARPDLLASQLNVTAVRNASLEMVVTEDGLVERYRVEFVGTDRGQEVRGATTLAYSALGETEVEAPAWSSEMRTQNEENGSNSTTQAS